MDELSCLASTEGLTSRSHRLKADTIGPRRLVALSIGMTLPALGMSSMPDPSLRCGPAIFGSGEVS